MAPKKKRPSSGSKSHDAAAIRIKIIPATDATPIKSLLVYARNKVGKTRLCASAGELGKTLVIDCEKGTSSIRKSENVDVYHLTHWEEINEIYWYLRTQDHGYEYVCIDPITKLGNLCMEYVLALDIDPEDEELSVEEQEDARTPDQRSWGKTAALVRRTILRYSTLPGVFLIITAYERRRENDDEDEDAFDFVIGPDAQPSVKGFLMGHCDIIGRLYLKALDSDDDNAPTKMERRILFGPHEIYDCGDRSDNLPRVMRRPTMKKILDIVQGETDGNQVTTARRRRS